MVRLVLTAGGMHRFIVLALFIVGCSSSTPLDGGPGDDARAPDGGSDAGTIEGVVCTGTGETSFPSFGRTCAGDADCTMGEHQTDCCGSVLVTGFAASERARFDAAESACRAMYPGCGCASGTVDTDDGGEAPIGSRTSAVVVGCVAGACTTSVREGAPCGAETCTPSQVCVMECGGIDGGTLRSHCIDVPPACATSTSCDCFGTEPCPTGTCVTVENGVPLCMCA